MGREEGCGAICFLSVFLPLFKAHTADWQVCVVHVMCLILEAAMTHWLSTATLSAAQPARARYGLPASPSRKCFLSFEAAAARFPLHRPPHSACSERRGCARGNGRLGAVGH